MFDCRQTSFCSITAVYLNFFKNSILRSQSEMSVPEGLLKQARASGQLNLSNRELTAIPESVWRVNVDGTRSQDALSFDAEDRWWEQVGLSRLILASNKLQSIDDGIEMLPDLTFLDAHDNLISRISRKIEMLRGLKALNLGQNRLCDLPRELLSFESLESLKLNDNQLKVLGDEVSRLRGLRELVMIIHLH